MSGCSPVRSPMIGPDAVPVKLGEVAADEQLEQAHQVADFGFRPRPVFRREGVDGQPIDAELAGGAHALAQRLDAGAMAGQPRQAARLGPAAVAVHDDRYMRVDLTCLVSGAGGSRQPA